MQLPCLQRTSGVALQGHSSSNSLPALPLPRALAAAPHRCSSQQQQRGPSRGGPGRPVLAPPQAFLLNLLGDNKLAPGDPLPKDYDKMTPNFDKGRRAGVILHPTSLPGPNGIGELGEEAFRFVDWLSDAGLQVWQMLPMVPPDPMFYSPYSGTDANCGNPLAISLNELVKLGLLDHWEQPPSVPIADVNFPAVEAVKNPLLRKAAQRLLGDDRFKGLRGEYEHFRTTYAAWIEDSAMFDVARNLPELRELAWWDWPEPLRLRDPATIKEFREKNKDLINEFIAVQFFFERQWKAVRAYANGKGIKIVGDMPIYVGGHSSDVWANRGLFELNEEGKPDQVSGVPPDAFSATGQLWGSPLYRWPAHKKEGYKWWVSRMVRALQLYDECRIDHFRGFAGYWSISAKEETAMNGSWRQGPGLELFSAVKKALGGVPILAEDLGVITTDVVALREAIGAPGMVVLQFAWGGGPTNVHLPHNHYDNCFVYPGTHDNETTVGWFKGSASATDKAYLMTYLKTDGSDIAYDFIKSCMASVAGTCVIMMQDVMRLDNTARMNTPGTAPGNWKWRMGDSGVWERLKKEAGELRAIAHDTNRIKRTPPPAK